ncbi:hypothetical protein MRX96_048916 [Rhipicephalus microplus]
MAAPSRLKPKTFFGKFEITFLNMDVVKRFKAELEIFVGKTDVKLQYRSALTMTVRVLGYLDGYNDKDLANELMRYGKVIEIGEKSVPCFESISTGAR